MALSEKIATQSAIGHNKTDFSQLHFPYIQAAPITVEDWQTQQAPASGGLLVVCNFHHHKTLSEFRLKVNHIFCEKS